MITRIVKLEFQAEHVPQFTNLFSEVQSEIKSRNGCLELRLLRDMNKPEIFFTVSKWDSVDALEAYRASKFFRSTWTKTKQWFARDAQAWSTKPFEDHTLIVE